LIDCAEANWLAASKITAQIGRVKVLPNMASNLSSFDLAGTFAPAGGAVEVKRAAPDHDRE
jgi:hypothetical protein